MVLELPVAISILASGIFLLVGLLSGIWKFSAILKSESGTAHPYIDIAHRASLLYSFASLVLATLVYFSPYSEAVQLIAISTPLFFFALAIATYLYHGFVKDTENQFFPSSNVGNSVMVGLIIGEVGGVGVLIWGFLESQQWFGA
ncbi:MAG: hypothetical protein P1V97_06755 [Planctomycetota bacterium]|nr:hypothetical protein [Planctomycetota bacterium]